MTRKTFLLVLASIATVVCTALTRIALFEPYVVWIYVLAAFIAAIKECANAMTGKTVRTAGSRRFYRFFSKWYRQNGMLIICCRGLRWLDGKILDALEERDPNYDIELFYADDENHLDEIRQRLGSRLHLHKVDINLIKPFSFSKLIPAGEGKEMYIIRYDAEEKNHEGTTRKKRLIHNNDGVREKVLIDRTIDLLMSFSRQSIINNQIQLKGEN